MKARVISYDEIEERFRQIQVDFDRRPLDEESIVDKGAELCLLLGVCISQMKASNSASYPEKRKHLTTLERAAEVITYSINTCTVEEVVAQTSAAYAVFGVH